MTKLQLTIYLNEADRKGDLALHEVVVRRLLHLEIAGATVTLGVMGYGRHGQVHSRRLLGVSDDRPVIITTIDNADRIRGLLPELKALVPEGLFTLHEIEIA